MAANGKPRQYIQLGAAMVTPDIQIRIERMAREEDRPIAYMIRKLIEESPRIKASRKAKTLKANGSK